MTSDQKPLTSDPQRAAADWHRMRFKKNKVWMAVDASGQPVVKEDKVLIKYQLKQDYEYWVKKSNVTQLEPTETATARPAAKTAGKKLPDSIHRDPDAPLEQASSADQICVFTDGASSGNPGPSGIGIVLRYGEHEKEISRFIGHATNNIAELKAIDAGLSALKNRDIPVRLFTDSRYAYGLLVLNWKPKENLQIIESIRKKMTGFKDLKIVKVKAHSGHPGNERADQLATSAIKKQKSPSN